MTIFLKALSLASLATLALAAPASAGLLFTNTAPIAVPGTDGTGNTNPFPSSIDVMGLPGTITDVNVLLRGVSHAFTGDINVVLEGPSGTTVYLWADAGGGANINNLNIGFDDEALTPLPEGNGISAGIYQVSQFGNEETFPVPASFGSLLSDFDGQSANGTWNLYVLDDFLISDTGSIAGGWELDISTNAVAVSEPASLALMGLGLIGVAASRRRKG